jgi:hypothetical protein
LSDSVFTISLYACGPRMSSLTSRSPPIPTMAAPAHSAARSRSGVLLIWQLRPPPAPASSPSGRSGRRPLPLRRRLLPLRPPRTPAQAAARFACSRSGHRPPPIWPAPPRPELASALPMAGLAGGGPGRRWLRRSWPWPEVAASGLPELAIVVNATDQKKRETNNL